MNDFELNNNYLRVEGAPPAEAVRSAIRDRGFAVGRIRAKLAMAGGVRPAGEVKGLIVGRIGAKLAVTGGVGPAGEVKGLRGTAWG